MTRIPTDIGVFIDDCSPLEHRVTDHPTLARAFRWQLRQDVQNAFILADEALEEVHPSQLSSKAELSARSQVFQDLHHTVMMELKVAEQVSLSLRACENHYSLSWLLPLAVTCGTLRLGVYDSELLTKIPSRELVKLVRTKSNPA
jgi:hypothetical protein